MWRRRHRKDEPPPPPQDTPYSIPYEPKPPTKEPPPMIPFPAGVENRSELQGDEPLPNTKHISGSDAASYNAHYGSPAPTYTSFDSAPRTGQRPIHELGVNF